MYQSNTKLSLTGNDLNASWKARPRQPHGKNALPNSQNNGMPGPKMQAPQRLAAPNMAIDPYMRTSPSDVRMNAPNMASSPYSPMSDGSTRLVSTVFGDIKQYPEAARMLERPDLYGAVPPPISNPTISAGGSVDLRSPLTQPQNIAPPRDLRPPLQIDAGAQPAAAPQQLVGDIQVPGWASERYGKRGLDASAMQQTWGKELEYLKSQVPEAQYKAYIANATSGRRKMSPREAANYWNSLPQNTQTPSFTTEGEWQSGLSSLRKIVPQKEYDAYVRNIARGEHTISPQEAANYWIRKQAQNSVTANSEATRQRVAKEGFSPEVQAVSDEADRKAREQVDREYGPVSSRYDASDAITKNQRRADSMAASTNQANSQLQEMQKDDPAGRLARIYGNQPITSGIAQREMDSASAGFYNDMASREKAASDANLAAQEKNYTDWAAKRDSKYESQRKEYGINDPAAAQSKLATLTAQTNRMNQLAAKSGEQPLTLPQVVQAKINTGELTIDSDVVKLLASQGHKFQGDQFSGELDEIYGNRVQQARNDTTANLASRDASLQQRKATAQARGQAIAQNVNAGMPVSTAAYMADNPQAAQSGGGGGPSIDQMASGLINGGMEPVDAYRLASNQYNANQAAQQNRDELAYNRGRDERAINRETARDQLLYQTEMAKLNAAERQDLANFESQAWMEATARNGGRMPRVGEQEYDRTVATINARRAGMNIPPIQTSAATPTPVATDGTKAAPAQRDQAGINRTVESIKKDETFDINNPTSIALAARVAARDGLSLTDQREAISKVMGVDYSSPVEAKKALNLIKDKITQYAKESGQNDAGFMTGGQKSHDADAQRVLSEYNQLLKVLAISIPPEEMQQWTRDLVAELHTTKKFSRSTIESIGNMLINANPMMPGAPAVTDWYATEQARKGQ
jgi:hypothetical protein